MKPRSELNPGVWQGETPTVPSGSGSRGVREMLLDAETRRRGETRGEHLFRIGFRACKATQESQNLRARRQRRSYGFAARLSLGWKADQRSARRIPQLVWCISMLAGGGKTWTQRFLRTSRSARRLFRLGRDRVEFERCCLTRRRGGAETAEIVRLRSEGSRWGGRLTKTARGGYRSWSGAFRCWQGEGRHGPNIRFLRTSRSARRLFRLGRDRVEFERCCLTRRRGGAEKHAENIFSGLASVLARLRRKVKTCERGDSGGRTASQRGSRLGWKADQRSARRIPQLVWCISMLAGGGKTWTQYKISANFPLRPPTVPSGSGSRGVRE